MKRTVLEKIVALRGMIFRLEHPELVMKEMKSIFKMIDQLEDTVIKEKAIVALSDLSIDMMKELDSDLLETVLDLLETVLEILKNMDDEIERKTVPVKIKTEEYLDVTVINIDKKVPYEELLYIINKVRKDFGETEEYLDFMGYNKKDKNILISYSKNKCKDIIINIKAWNMSKEVAEVYTEGFAEYLKK